MNCLVWGKHQSHDCHPEFTAKPHIPHSHQHGAGNGADLFPNRELVPNVSTAKKKKRTDPGPEKYGSSGTTEKLVSEFGTIMLPIV